MVKVRFPKADVYNDVSKVFETKELILEVTEDTQAIVLSNRELSRAMGRVATRPS